MSPAPHRAETPAPSPESGGPRPASASLAPPDDDNADRQHSPGPPPDYRDDPGLEPGRAPPDSAAQPARDSPDTIVHWPPGPGTSPPTPGHGAAPGSAATPGQCRRSPAPGASRQRRSEEHTSELQSLRHLVCRLLLEKKNK